ncbi:diguanylate cyclase domain-containing protein [Thermomonas sp.]
MKLGQRLLAMVEGELARLPRGERTRLVAWQEMRTRVALGDLMSLLAIIASAKVALVLTGLWPAGLPAWIHSLALVVLLLGRFGYARSRGLGSEGVAATLFTLGLITILADPPPHWWIEQPGLTLGWVWLLAALVIPLLARLASVMVFCGLLLAAAALFFALVPSGGRESLSILLYLLVSIAGGLLLRKLRSDMSLVFRRSTEAVAQAANTDALTGVANRRGWREQAPPMLAQVASSNRPISLLFIDLDHFKRLNDLHGHAAGDDALRRVGQLLAARIDVGLAARLGGEEFVCLLPGLDENAATLFAHSLRDALAQGPDPLSFSGGVAQWRHGEDLTDLLGRGDAAMYRAKQAGRDRVMPAN